MEHDEGILVQRDSKSENHADFAVTRTFDPGTRLLGCQKYQAEL
jgi:hypothetical protein